MLSAVWETVGIIGGLILSIIGLIILFAIGLFILSVLYGFLTEGINLAIAAGNVIAAWIDEKLHKK